MQFLLVSVFLHLRLESLSALGELALVRVLGDKGLLLCFMFLGMLRLYVALENRHRHASPPHILGQTNLTFVAEIP